MRLWSVHPNYLDTKGLVALWREALLAQKVLRGETKGYRHHPQLTRFRQHSEPLVAIAQYLLGVWNEADKRGYKFALEKIGTITRTKHILVTSGQLDYEFKWLCKKVESRNPEMLKRLKTVTQIEPHPLFIVVRGGIEDWEKARI